MSHFGLAISAPKAAAFAAASVCTVSKLTTTKKTTKQV